MDYRRVRRQKRLDDGFVRFGRCKARPAQGITEEEFIEETVEGATGVAIGEHLTAWLNGKGDDLPFDALFARVGLGGKKQKPAEPVKLARTFQRLMLLKLFTGLTLKTEGGRLVVAQVEDYSPAYEAGLGADDEIIFVNSSRCTSADELDVLLAKQGENNTSEIVISSDTGMVTLSLTPKKMPDSRLLRARTQVSKKKRSWNFGYNGK